MVELSTQISSRTLREPTRRTCVGWLPVQALQGNGAHCIPHLSCQSHPIYCSQWAEQGYDAPTTRELLLTEAEASWVIQVSNCPQYPNFTKLALNIFVWFDDSCTVARQTLYCMRFMYSKGGTWDLRYSMLYLLSNWLAFQGLVHKQITRYFALRSRTQVIDPHSPRSDRIQVAETTSNCPHWVALLVDAALTELAEISQPVCDLPMQL